MEVANLELQSFSARGLCGLPRRYSYGVDLGSGSSLVALTRAPLNPRCIRSLLPIMTGNPTDCNFLRSLPELPAQLICHPLDTYVGLLVSVTGMTAKRLA
jgi:hypothetical protein